MSGIDNARRIARAMDAAAKRRADVSAGRTKVGFIASLEPLLVETGGGGQMPSEALLWSNAAMATRDNWSEGDSVVMSLVEGDIYIVQDVLFTGSVIGGMYNIDGGNPSSTYLPDQVYDGGSF